MPRIFIVYGTTEGQTRKIAMGMAKDFESLGHEVKVINSASREANPFAESPDGIVIGGSVHQGKHQGTLIEFVRRNRERIAIMPNAFFSVSLASASGAEDDKNEAQSYIERFRDETEWDPEETICFAGALRYMEYDFFKRFVMKMISKRTGHPTDTSRDYEYTDWDAVKRFAEGFGERVDASLTDERRTRPGPWPEAPEEHP
jgi:menaquinone-dependent protoporphyrinogen oxidase